MNQSMKRSGTMKHSASKLMIATVAVALLSGVAASNAEAACACKAKRTAYHGKVYRTEEGTDYDRGYYHLLDLEGKIAYMRARVARDLIKPCRIALCFSEHIHVGLLVPTLICSGISAASTFQNGREAPWGQDQSYFVGFVHSYMDSIFKQNAADPKKPKDDTYADWLSEGDPAPRPARLVVKELIEAVCLRPESACPHVRTVIELVTLLMKPK